MLIYSEVLQSHWCTNIPILIHSDQLVRVEKGLMAMHALVHTCGFSRETAAVKNLVKQLQADTHGDIEYTRHLLELCQSLLTSMHDHNSEL